MIRPHRSVTYTDAAYYYRPNSVASRSVGFSVCRSVALVSPTEAAEPIEISFCVVNSDVSEELCVIWGSTSAKGRCHRNQFLALDAL